MPELSEVEMVARTLRSRLVGRRIISVDTSGKLLCWFIERAKLNKLDLTRFTSAAQEWPTRPRACPTLDCCGGMK